MRYAGRRIQDRMKRIIRHASFIMYPASFYLVVFCSLVFSSHALAGDLELQPLIDEALKNSPEIRAAQARVSASTYRIPQAKTLPDPMFMIGYQNEGWRRYTFGETSDAQWMFSASQMFPFPGKLSLKGEMAARESESSRALYDSVRLRTIARVRELYYELFLAYKNIDLIRDKGALFSRLEDAALARYSSGMGQQQEVLMAQTEKYMLLEREEMFKQKVQSLEAMLNSTTGRDVTSPLGRPAGLPSGAQARDMDELLRRAYENSPEIRSREKMIAAAEARVRMAGREYYPDFTVNANYANRGGGEFPDMWSLTTTINVPIYYRTKQKQAVLEAEASLSEAQQELAAARLMIASNISDSYSMHKTAEKLMELYKDGLIPKIYQDFESALAGYATGKVEALTVINRLKALIDFELLYWGQAVEKEKAAARIDAAAGITDTEPGGR